MRWSQMFIPTLRQSPKEADRVVALLTRAGYGFASGGRLAAFLPLGAACLNKLKGQLAARLSAAGGEEIIALIHQRADVSASRACHAESHGQASHASAATDVDGLLWEIAGRHIHSYNQLPRLWFCSTPHACEQPECFIHCMYLSLREATRESSANPIQQVLSDLAAMLHLPVIRASGVPVIGREAAATEFLCLSPDGYVQVARCACGYAANLDCAVSKVSEPLEGMALSGQPRLVETPGMKTIADVSNCLKVPSSSLIKSLLYMASGRPLLVLVRGDDQLNERRLQQAVGSYDLRPANPEEIWQSLGADPGSIGPVGVGTIRILADDTLRFCHDMASGANKDEWHLTGVEPERDFHAEYTHLRQVCAQDPCPQCSRPLTVSRGRLLLRSATLLPSPEDVGAFRVLGPDNKLQPALATTHRIDLHAFLQSVVERFSDEHGLVLSPVIAPFDVLITPVKYDDAAQKHACESACESLQKQNLHVLIDDRDASPGVKFKDADLIGIPLRVTIGPKKLREGKVELGLRATSETFDCSIEDVAQRVIRALRAAGAAHQPR